MVLSADPPPSGPVQWSAGQRADEVLFLPVLPHPSGSHLRHQSSPIKKTGGPATAQHIYYIKYCPVLSTSYGHFAAFSPHCSISNRTVCTISHLVRGHPKCYSIAKERNESHVLRTTNGSRFERAPDQDLRITDRFPGGMTKRYFYKFSWQRKDRSDFKKERLK